ncbi:MAG: protein kinase [Planctomycetes bacterium]|nr:protein kinase [Planctomycetota bacterium]
MPESAQSGFSTRLWQPGDSGFPILLEHYQIVGIIGEGGMGTVFKAHHLNLKRFVAIKTLKIDQRHSEELIGRFKQEMELVGQMDHPNVVRATDAGERNGVFYLVMEYLSGSDLSRLVHQRGRLDTAFACDVIRQAALGLDYIHEKGLVHRDIKPSNLMLTRDRTVKILDLGLARFGFTEADKHELTPAGYAVGTYSYMAPEQATTGADIDARADLYSLGCTFFRLLTGRTPYSGSEYDNPAKVLYAHCHVPLSSTPEFDLVPEDLRPVFSRLTAKDPADRFQTGREVADALAPFLADKAITPIPVETKADEEIAETPVRPLTDPWPEELSRLTGSPHETPPDSAPATPSVGPTVSAPVPAPAPTPTPVSPRWLALGGIAMIGIGLAAWLLISLAPWREPVGPPRKDDDKPPGPVVHEVISLPIESAQATNIDLLKPGQWHKLLADPKAPPPLIGFEKSNPLASVRWTPGQQKLELMPTKMLLIPLGTTSKAEPSFEFQVFMHQMIWHKNVGLFWGYQENGRAKAKAKKGEAYAHFQYLKLCNKTQSDQGGQVFYFSRYRGELAHDGYGGALLLEGTATNRHDLSNLGSERSFTIRVNKGVLEYAQFGADPLKTLVRPNINKDYQPSDYQGAFGIFSFAANAIVREAAVMPH